MSFIRSTTKPGSFFSWLGYVWFDSFLLKEIINEFSEDSNKDDIPLESEATQQPREIKISLQATEIAANIAVVEYLMTMTVLGIDPGVVYDQVNKLPLWYEKCIFAAICAHITLTLNPTVMGEGLQILEL